MKRRVILFSFIFTLFLVSCNSVLLMPKGELWHSFLSGIISDDVVDTLQKSADKKPKNIIILVGDGMGMGHVQLASLALNGAEEKINIDKMAVTGLLQTWSLGDSSDSIMIGSTTDSAASATAFATGCKTINGKISVDPQNRRVETLFEVAHREGYHTGVISTHPVTDATPSSWYAHVKNRSMQSEIARQFVDSEVDLAFGGGAVYFADYWDALRAKGFAIAQTKKEMDALSSLPAVALLGDQELKEERPEPYLWEMAEKSLDLMAKAGKPFLLMVEGEEIDTFSHQNRGLKMVRSTLIFDRTVGTALKFASKRDDTLVVVFADHETGGLVVHDFKTRGVAYRWNSTHHTTQRVVVYACGPGSGAFTGVMDNTDLFKKMKQYVEN